MGRPVVIAHRGLADGTASGPENTVTAIARAARTGASGVELDVRQTRDGKFVLNHDPIRWARGPRLIRWSRARALGLCDLADGLRAAADAGLTAKLDVKDAGDLSTIATQCRSLPVDPTAIALWCRSADAIRGLPERDQFGEIALLSNSADPVAYPDAAHHCGASAVSLHPRALSATAVGHAHEAGLTVYAWIRNRAAHEPAVALGVDGLVTDWVAEALAAAR